MFLRKNKNASTFIYILLLINIAIMMGVIVYNNAVILSNNINIGKNSEQVFLNIYNKANINIESVRKYNGNGNGYIDVISCPTNVTMSGTYDTGSLMQTGISTEMVYVDGSIFCRGYYNLDEFRIFYNSNFSDFVKAYYDWGEGTDIVDLKSPLKVNTGNLLEESGVTIKSSLFESGFGPENSADNDPLTEFVSISMKSAYIEFKLANSYNIGKIIIEKDSNTSSAYWNAGSISFFNSSYIELPNTKIHLAGMRQKDYYEVDLGNSALLNSVQYIRIESTSALRILDLRDVYVYKQIVTDFGGLSMVVNSPSDYIREGIRTFNDPDLTLISFDANGVGGGDSIDDNFNSDDYKVTSNPDNDTYYFTGFQDDDVVPRLTFFGSIEASDSYYNVFWNNYKTNNFVSNNTNNNDSINVKIGDVESAYMYFDLFSDSDIIYDLKIIEFDRDKYKDEFTLLPIHSYEGINLSGEFGYIEENNGVLSLSPVKTGDEFVFDFKNNDYAIFLLNKGQSNLSYRLNSETSTGTQIYINPIDDSGTGSIKTLSNHIIIGGERNFIGENFTIVGAK
ncbi:MAG: hypothetical protein PHH06_03535 [Candidatus Gracilibacteria bacterium]|nr:hypothetical protein [Candidatus Gracilibacteria bacterium]